MIVQEKSQRDFKVFFLPYTVSSPKSQPGKQADGRKGWDQTIIGSGPEECSNLVRANQVTKLEKQII